MYVSDCDVVVDVVGSVIVYIVIKHAGCIVVVNVVVVVVYVVVCLLMMLLLLPMIAML